MASTISPPLEKITITLPPPTLPKRLKNSALNLRISSVLKSAIEAEAKARNITTTDFVTAVLIEVLKERLNSC